VPVSIVRDLEENELSSPIRVHGLRVKGHGQRGEKERDARDSNSRRE